MYRRIPSELILAALWTLQIALAAKHPPSTSSSSPSSYYKTKALKSDYLLPRPSSGPGESMQTNSISNALGEPSCEELRAMWRYYKRQSRAAELTNQIPQMQPFWEPSYYGGGGSRRRSGGRFFGSNRGRSFLRPGPGKIRKYAKSSADQPVFGRVVSSPRSEDRSRVNLRPMEEVRFQMFGGPGSGARKLGNGPTEPIIHYSPATGPKEPSSFQKIREEIIGSRSPIQNQGGVESEYGKLRMSPPKGSDGRAVNKPKELMSSFEKIRFGHADDLLEGGSGGSEPLLKDRLDKRWRPPPVMLPILKMMRNRQSGAPADSRTAYNVGESMVRPEEQIIEIVPYEEEVDEDTAEDLISGWGSPPLPLSVTDEGGGFFSNEPLSPLADSAPTSPPVEFPTCPELEGQSCSSNSDCSCTGYGLFRCHLSRCQFITFSPKSGGESGRETFKDSWHSSPLQSNHLGVWESNGDDGGVRKKDF